MPIYEYQCDACGKRVEVIQHISEKPLKVCPHCGKKKLRKLISASAFKLKGTGWYVTDFKDKKPQTEEKTKEDKPAEKMEAKGSEKETAKSADAGEKKAAEKMEAKGSEKETAKSTDAGEKKSTEKKTKTAGDD